MPAELKLSIITPEKILIEVDAQMVTIPGTEGEFGVLEGHAPFVSTIRPGVIVIDLPSGPQRKVAITGGITEVIPERCTVLAEIAEECTSVTAAEAQSRVDAAKAALDNAITEATRKDAEKKLILAEAIALAAA